jgi:FkbM family methyltransferase
MNKRVPLTRVELMALVLVVVMIAGYIGFSVALDVANARYQQFTRFVADENSELEALSAAYGPQRNSENAEEWIVRDFFGDERNGVFLDVGANHYQQNSNTYYLETALGWSGVAIEPQAQFAEEYRQFRPRTTFVPLFVSDVSNQQATLYLTRNHLVASGSRDFTATFGDVTPTPTTTTTLDDVLNRLQIPHVDFMSLDIELGEPRALAGFSIGRARPRLVAVEAHHPVRQQILEYFARHDYALVGKYWSVDNQNFWFAPVGTVRDSSIVTAHSH